MAAHTFESYEDFWPYYVAMHSKAATRWVHLAGTLTGLAVSVYGAVRRRPRLLLGLPVIGYGTAWPAHFLIEGNNPATFGHPAWSLRGDAQMIRMMLAGRDAELAETAAKWLAEHPEHAGAAGRADSGQQDSAQRDSAQRDSAQKAAEAGR